MPTPKLHAMHALSHYNPPPCNCLTILESACFPAFQPLPHTLASTSKAMCSPVPSLCAVGGPSYTSLPADEFHDAPDEFAVDSHPIGDLQDSDSAVSGLAGGEGTAPEGPGIAAKEPHDAGGEIK